VQGEIPAGPRNVSVLTLEKRRGDPRGCRDYRDRAVVAMVQPILTLGLRRFVRPSEA